MLHRLTLITVTAVVALGGAFALTSAEAGTGGMPTASGSLAPAGQGPGLESPANGSFTASRTTIKERTRSAASSGSLVPAGEAAKPVAAGADNDTGGTMFTTGSTVRRDSVKADVSAARANGTLQPAGDTSQPASARPPK